MIETPLTLTGEFIQAVVTYDRNNPGSTDTLRLYVNGTEVGTSPVSNSGTDDWDGGDDAGLGGRNGTTGGSGAAPTLDSHDGRWYAPASFP